MYTCTRVHVQEKYPWEEIKALVGGRGLGLGGVCDYIKVFSSHVKVNMEMKVWGGGPLRYRVLRRTLMHAHVNDRFHFKVFL